MEINIVVHGNSKGFNSGFMQYLAKGLKEDGMKLYGFDFDYITNNSEPSVGLVDELDQLKNVIDDFKSKGYGRINLIGKSLGGTLCLDSEIANDSSIDKIVIVGFPYILGFPADLKLLKRKPVVANPEAEKMYIEVFKELGKNAEKVNIIQGKDDLLGSTDSIEFLISNLAQKITVFYIDNASHGFKPIKENSTLEENMQKVMDIIKSII